MLGNRFCLSYLWKISNSFSYSCLQRNLTSYLSSSSSIFFLCVYYYLFFRILLLFFLLRFRSSTHWFQDLLIVYLLRFSSAFPRIVIVALFIVGFTFRNFIFKLYRVSLLVSTDDYLMVLSAYLISPMRCGKTFLWTAHDQ